VLSNLSQEVVCHPVYRKEENNRMIEITGVYRHLLEFTGDYWSLLAIT